MRLSVSAKIAGRYLFSKKSHNAVNVITGVALCTTAVATAAIIVVLSVFNGFKELASTRYSKIDAPIKIVNAAETPFDADSLIRAISHIDHLGKVNKVITTDAYATNGPQRALVSLRGVDSLYFAQLGVEGLLIDGVAYVGDTLDSAWGVLGSGLAVNLQARPGVTGELRLMAPRRKGRLNLAAMLTAFRTETVNVAGVIEANDERIDLSLLMVPYEAARRLAGLAPEEATSVELFPCNGFDKKELDDALRGSGLSALDVGEQNSEAFKMINIEKWVSFSLLVFILVIASLNIVSALSMLIIEKRPNMGILSAIGCTDGDIRRIFVLEGFMLSVLGGLSGCVVGALLVLTQQWFGVVKLSSAIDPSLLAIDHYPVQLKVDDFLVVIAVIAILSLLTTWLSVTAYTHKSTMSKTTV